MIGCTELIDREISYRVHDAGAWCSLIECTMLSDRELSDGCMVLSDRVHGAH